MSAYVEPLTAMFTLDQLVEAGDVAVRDPASLTDRQIGMLAAYSQSDAQEAIQRREQARRARVDADVQQRYTKAMRSASAARPGWTARLPNVKDGDLSSHEALEQWAKDNALCVVPVALWAAFVSANREKRGYLESRTTVLETENSALKARVAALEAGPKGPSLTGWSGEHESGKTYEAGSLCRRNNSVWIALRSTTSAPGSISGDWEIFTKGVALKP